MTIKTREKRTNLKSDVILGEFSPLTMVNESTVNNNSVLVKLKLLSYTATVPTYATKESACFDLYSDFGDTDLVTVYTNSNTKYNRSIFGNELSEKYIVLDSGDRALIPTNLIFDIPIGYELLVFPRSGCSLKEGISLCNSVGVVDSDYTDPCFILIHNISGVRITIKHKERLAQAKLQRIIRTNFMITDETIQQKTDRTGGFGSTGK